MKAIDKKKVFLFRRVLSNKNNLSYLIEKNDNELLEILNSTVLPNSIDENNLKYSLFFTILFKKDLQQSRDKVVLNLKKILSLIDNLTRVDKNIIQHGVINGFTSNNSKLEFYNFLNNTSTFKTKDTSKKGKILSFSKFLDVFPFAYNLIKRGENNERFPRL